MAVVGLLRWLCTAQNEKVCTCSHRLGTAFTQGFMQCMSYQSLCETLTDTPLPTGCQGTFPLEVQPRRKRYVRDPGAITASS